MFLYHTSYMRFSYAGELEIKELSSCALAFLLQNAEPINRGDIVKYMALQTSEVVRVTMDVFSAKNRWWFNHSAMLVDVTDRLYYCFY